MVCKGIIKLAAREVVQSTFHIQLIFESRFVNSLEEEGLCSEWVYPFILILLLKKGERDLSHWGEEKKTDV